MVNEGRVEKAVQVGERVVQGQKRRRRDGVVEVTRSCRCRVGLRIFAGEINIEEVEDKTKSTRSKAIAKATNARDDALYEALLVCIRIVGYICADSGVR